ncbi:MAG: helix-turn-helix transcriptional regulator [Chitinophagaceae bacterium]|nr:helix-turn-helix transcriptional regulator [Chitinophagaceae bacterium]
MPGSVIRKFRDMRNYSQEYVARKMGISQNAYSKIENNITQLTVKHIKSISQILEISVTDLLKDDFEIHGSSNIQTESVTKDVLLMTIESLKKKLSEKHPEKHDFYPVIMTLLQSVDNTIANVH